jgi:GMP synthase (glutamine-hydrolysing)
VGRKRVLIAKTGDTLDSVRERLGDFDWMFLRFCEGVEAEVVDVPRRPEDLPDPRGLDGLIITGSPHSVTRREPWAERLAEWSARAVELGVPTLGVCYGHQLLGYALGGEVQKNDRRFELGTIEVELTEAGRAEPILGGLAPGEGRLPFFSVHGDVVTRLPDGAVCLARNAVADHQAFAWRDHVRTVQFHPEITPEIGALYVEGRAPLLAADARRRGTDPEAELAEVRAGLRPTPLGPALIQRFLAHYVRKESPQ